MDTRLTPGAAPKRMKPFTTFKLVCPSFRNGGKIPPRFTSDGADISPVLAWVDPPEDTKQFALIMEEPDAPQNERTHWIVYGIPPDAAGLPEGLAKAAQLPDRIFQGKNDFGQIGYAGPRQAPPVSHRYFFQIFALNADIKLHAGAVIQEFKAALRGKILATANLAASYEASPCKPINDAVAAGEVDAATDVPDENPLPSVLKKRLLALNTDKEFILQTNRCQTELKEAYKQNPKAVEDFFKRFSLTSAFAEGRIRKYFMAEPDQNVRQPLADYVRYANRFRVQFRLRTSPLEFRLRPLISYGEKFHVELVKGHLEGMDTGRAGWNGCDVGTRSAAMPLLRASNRMLAGSPTS
jgi:Raf kinase inhibitor-like YbhB/YbcL family protein